MNLIQSRFPVENGENDRPCSEQALAGSETTKVPPTAKRRAPFAILFSYNIRICFQQRPDPVHI